MKSIRSATGKVLVRPYLIYCYKSIVESLQALLMHPNFYNDCESWRSKVFHSGYYNDVYD